MGTANIVLLCCLSAVGGLVIGYFVSKSKYQDTTLIAKLNSVQKEYDDYRVKVRENFIDTVSQLGKIDEQQKQLCHTVADGISALCDNNSDKDDFFLEQSLKELQQLEHGGDKKPPSDKT